MARFESSALTIPTASPWNVNVAHGLARIPDLWSASLRCVTTELGYAVNDEISISCNLVGSSVVGPIAWATATTIGCSCTIGSADFYIVNKTTGAQLNITKGNWRIILRALIL